MQINKKFIISCKHFGGFAINVDINLFENKQQIIEHVLVMLNESLSQLSLECLTNLLNIEKKNYHIHDYDFGHFFIEKGPFYICNHCNDYPVPANQDISSVEIDILQNEVQNDVQNDVPNEVQNEVQNEVPNEENQEDSTIDNFFNLYNSIVNNDYKQIENENEDEDDSNK